MKYLYILLSVSVFTVQLLASCGDTVQEPVEEISVEIPLGKLYAEAVAILEEAQERAKPDLSTTELQLSHMRQSESWDRYQTGILPMMSEDAPDYCRQILESEGKRFIVVDKAKMKLFLYDPYGNIEKSYGIACAKNYGTKHKKGDSRTTEGIFLVKGVFDSTNWLFTDDNGYTSPVKGQYGPRFIRLNIPYIGIHGTASPGSIGRRCSHGCIRVTNTNILELVEFVEEGMPVIISPGPRDMAVNRKEGYNILAVATEPDSKRAVEWKEPEPGQEEEKREVLIENIDLPEVQTASGQEIEKEKEGESQEPISEQENEI